MNSPLQLDRFRFTKTTLANGLDVIARRQGPLPVVAVNLWYHVGSKNEERRQRGFAHLFEHLMFEGSEHYPGDFFKPLQRIGASINGSTSSDRTNYYEDVPAAHVELALAMESDRMGHFLPALTDAKLRVQKDVVKNEYRQNVANRPYGRVGRLLAESMFPPGHPYSWTTIGVMEDVEAAGLDDVEAFFRRFYVPGNASLSIVGDIDEDRALALADRYFGGLPGGTGALRIWAPEATLAAEVNLSLHDRVELDRVYLAWHTVPHFEPDDAALVVLGDILGRGKSGRLYRKLVVERELTQDVGAHQSGRELAGTFGVNATLRPGKSWEEVRDVIDAEIALIADRGVEEAELARVKNGRLAGFIYALDNVGGFGGVADRLNAYNTYLGDPGRITSDLARYQAVTAESVREVARSYLDRRKPRACLSVLGRKPPVVAGPIDRSVPPVASAAKPYQAPRPEVRSLRCGVPVWVLPRRELPIVAASIVLDAGASTHGPGQGGLASLTADMLDEGTLSRSSHEIALAIEGMGTSLSASAGWDGAYVGFQCLTPHLEPSLDLAVDILRNPAFPREEWARIHAQTLAGLQSERDSAEARAGRAMLRALFEADHPYRLPVDGDEATVSRLTREDLQAFHRGRYVAGHAACVVAGDVDPDEVVALLDARLWDWSGEHQSTREIARPARPDRPRLLLLDRPGAPQAVVRVGHAGTHRLDPDYMNLTVWNQILGGQFTSRLNARLREEKGFTYGVRSYFDFRKGAGPFVVSSSVQSDRLAEALEDLRGEVVALLGDRPPTAAELDDARRSLIEGQARHFETPSALVSRYAGLFLHGLPADYHARFAERLESVSLSTMEAAARRHVHPWGFVIVVVADAELVAGPLQALGWAEVERSDERDEPLGS
jgi:zinc protease